MLIAESTTAYCCNLIRFSVLFIIYTSLFEASTEYGTEVDV